MDNIVSKSSVLIPSFFESGAAILIDKPLEWTSFDVVNKLRYSIKGHLNRKKYKVGHAGTLDPLATGLLIVCFGKYTKIIDSIVAQTKMYTGEVTLGVDTPSYDAELMPHIYYPERTISSAELNAAQVQFTGPIKQLPPMYSAIKVKGVPLYKLAREGTTIERKLREVTINELNIEQKSKEKLSISVNCSKGTYIRTLAYDIGQFLNTGGFLSALRRTQIGSYSVDDALTIDEFLIQLESLK